MTISKRTLIKWRKEALQDLEAAMEINTNEFNSTMLKALNSGIGNIRKILSLTQELIDQELLKETKNA